MQSVILAGGLGTRLLPYTMFVPKPMLPLGEKPILEHIIEWNVKNGIDDIILCISYLGRMIEDYFGDGQRIGASIQYATARKPLATAGQLKTAQDMIGETFVCMYGDSIYGFDLSAMVRAHREEKAFVTMGLHEHDTTIPYGVIDTDGNGRVVAWREKPETRVQINMGCYVMEPGVMDYIPAGKPWGMDAVVRAAMDDGHTVSGHLADGEFLDVGTYSVYEEASREFRKRLGDI